MRISLKFIMVWLSTFCAAAASYASMMSQDPNTRLWRALLQAALVIFVGAVWHLYYISRRASDVVS
jgi:hypothetical protein